jgi:hypothetical protein
VTSNQTDINSTEIIRKLKEVLVKEVIDGEGILYNEMEHILDFGVQELLVKILIPNDPASNGKFDVLESPNFIVVDHRSINQLSFSHQISSTTQRYLPHSEDLSPSKMVGYEELVSDSISYLKNCHLLQSVYQLGTPNPGGLFLYGSPGTGRTTLAKVISKQFSQLKQTFTIYCDCEKLKSSPIESIQRYLNRLVNEAIWHQPAVIVLDNLDLLFAADGEGNSSRPKRLAHYFVDKFRPILDHFHIYMLATATGKESLHEQILSRHVFGKYFQLNTPNKTQRAEVNDF